ncbi:Tetratricopeptide repeat-containing protein, partial [Oryctes borbonicus]
SMFKMADVSEKMEGKTAKQLLGAGARAYATSNYNAAVQYLSRASEITVAEEGSHTHDSLGEIYFLYGKSLLELSREEGDPLGDVVPKDVAIVQEAEEEAADGESKAEDKDSEDEESEEGEDGDKGEEQDDVEEEDDEEDEDEKEGEDQENEKNAEKDNKEAEKNKKDECDAVVSDSDKINGKVLENCEKSVSSENVENAEKSKDGTTEDVSAGTSGEKPTENEEETASDLQVAWEVLELAKIIFTKRGEEAKPDLAETLITLGEISLESENFESAVNDIREGLEIQKTLYDDTDRTLAETHYKLGMALSMNNKIDEAIENFNRTIQLLKNRIEKLKDGQKSIEKKEVDEMRQLIPEIEEKIVDLRNYTEEVAKKTTEETRPILCGSPEKKATDISHLVKRKRKSLDNDDAASNTAKKPALNL